MRVERWGDSLAVRLPTALVEALDLKEDDHVEIYAAGKQPLAADDAPAARELLKRLRKYRGRLPSGFRFDRSAAHD
jgi:antitoxin MazE